MGSGKNIPGHGHFTRRGVHLDFSAGDKDEENGDLFDSSMEGAGPQRMDDINDMESDDDGVSGFFSTGNLESVGDLFSDL